MKLVEPEVSRSDNEHDNVTFNPMRNGAMVCICNFELIKQEDGVYKCTGGGHTYRINDGDIMYDKFGNILLKNPIDGGKEND